MSDEVTERPRCRGTGDPSGRIGHVFVCQQAGLGAVLESADQPSCRQCRRAYKAAELEANRAYWREHHARDAAYRRMKLALRRAAQNRAIPVRWLVGNTVAEREASQAELDRRTDLYLAARERGDKSVGLKTADLLHKDFRAMWNDWMEQLACCELLLGCKLVTDHQVPLCRQGEHSIENFDALTAEQNSSKATKTTDEWLATLPPPTFVADTGVRLPFTAAELARYDRNAKEWDR